MTRPIYFFNAQAESWGLPFLFRAYDELDAEGMVRILMVKDIKSGEKIKVTRLDTPPLMPLKPLHEPRHIENTAPQAATRGKGRPALDISPQAIIDSLLDTHSIKATAAALGCSRGHIYGRIGTAQIKEYFEKWGK